MEKVYNSPIDKNTRLPMTATGVLSLVELVLVGVFFYGFFYHSGMLHDVINRISDFGFSFWDVLLISGTVFLVACVAFSVVAMAKSIHVGTKICTTVASVFYLVLCFFVFFSGDFSLNFHYYCIFTFSLILTYDIVSVIITVCVIRRNNMLRSNILSYSLSLQKDRVCGTYVNDLNSNQKVIAFELLYSAILRVQTVDFSLAKKQYFNLVIEHKYGVLPMCIEKPFEVSQKINMCKAIIDAEKSIEREEISITAFCELCGKKVPVGKNLCSDCAEMFDFDDPSPVPYWCGMCGRPGPFGDECPHCGAKNPTL